MRLLSHRRSLRIMERHGCTASGFQRGTGHHRSLPARECQSADHRFHTVGASPSGSSSAPLPSCSTAGGPCGRRATGPRARRRISRRTMSAPRATRRGTSLARRRTAEEEPLRHRRSARGLGARRAPVRRLPRGRDGAPPSRGPPDPGCPLRRLSRRGRETVRLRSPRLRRPRRHAAAHRVRGVPRTAPRYPRGLRSGLTGLPEPSPETCGGCHGDPAVALRRLDASLRKPFLTYRDSVHGKLAARGSPSAAVCTDCHRSHDVLPPTTSNSPVSRANMPGTCGACHGDVLYEYRESVHGVASLKHGMSQSPVCTTCHGIHSIRAPQIPPPPSQRRRSPERPAPSVTRA